MASYFCNVSYSTAAKNKYQEVIFTLVKACDGQLIHNVEQFKEGLIKTIKEVHKLHPRCKALVPSWFNSEHDGGVPCWNLSMSGGDFRIVCELLPVRGEVKP